MYLLYTTAVTPLIYEGAVAISLLMVVLLAYMHINLYHEGEVLHISDILVSQSILGTDLMLAKYVFEINSK